MASNFVKKTFTSSGKNRKWTDLRQLIINNRKISYTYPKAKILKNFLYLCLETDISEKKIVYPSKTKISKNFYLLGRTTTPDKNIWKKFKFSKNRDFGALNKKLYTFFILSQIKNFSILFQSKNSDMLYEKIYIYTKN